MVTVDAVMKSLDKMRKVYPFKDDNTAFSMGGNIMHCENTMVSITTVDNETGVQVHLEKDAKEEMPKGEW